MDSPSVNRNGISRDLCDIPRETRGSSSNPAGYSYNPATPLQISTQIGRDFALTARYVL